MATFKFGTIIEGVNTTATSGGTLTLAYNSPKYQQFTGSTTHTVTLPNATTCVDALSNLVPVDYEIENRSSGAITVNLFGGTLAATVDAGSQRGFQLIDKTSSAGVWVITNESGAVVGVTPTDSISIMAALAKGEYQDASIVSKLIKVNPEELGGNVWTTKVSTAVNHGANGGQDFNGYGYSIGAASASGSTTTVERYSDDYNYYLSRAVYPTVINSTGVFTLGGFLYGAGGGNASVNLANAYKYDDSANSWSAIASLTNARRGHTAYSTSSYGYVVGGENPAGSAATTTVELYDPGVDAWYSRTPLGTAIMYSAGVNLNGLLYRFCGTTGSFSGASEKYDESKNYWVAVTTDPTARLAAAGFVTNGRAYIVGGYSGAAAGLALTEEYLDLTNAYATKSANTAGYAFCGFGLNGLGYINGGETNGTFPTISYQYRNASAVYLGSLRKSSSTPTSIFVATSVNGIVNGLPVQLRTNTSNIKKTFIANGDNALKASEITKAKFIEENVPHIVGGYTGSYSPNSANERYDRVNDSWTSRTAITAARYESANFGLLGKGYNVGGYNGGSTNTVYQFDDISNAWATKAANSLGNGYDGVGDALEGYGYTVGNTGVNDTGKYNADADTWAAVASTNSSRQAASGCALNGRFLVTGGTSNNTESYNPISNAWTNKSGTAAVNRNYGCGVNIEGYMYVVGFASAFTSSMDRYDDVADSFLARTALTNSAVGKGGFKASGFAHFCGGETAGPTVQSYNDQHNPAANTTVSKTGMITARSGIVSGSFNPGAYRNYEMWVMLPSLIAGLGASAWVLRATRNDTTNGGAMELLNGVSFYTNAGDSETFNEQLNAWKTAASRPTMTSIPTSFTLLGSMYVAAGSSGGTPQSSVYRIDVETGAWSTPTSLNQSRMRLTDGNGTALNGFGYVVGGSDAGGGNTYPGSEQYDPAVNSWTNKAAIINSTYVNYKSGWAVNGFWYCGNGSNGGVSTATNTFESYDDASNAWSSRTNVPVSQQSAASFVASGAAVIAGGDLPGTNAGAYEYKYLSDVWVTKQSIPVASSNNVSDSSGLVSGPSSGLGTYRYVPSQNSIGIGAALKVI